MGMKSPPNSPESPINPPEIDWSKVESKLSPEQLCSVGELAASYLKSDAVELSGVSLISALQSLHALATSKSRKMKEEHAQAVLSMILGSESGQADGNEGERTVLGAQILGKPGSGNVVKITQIAPANQTRRVDPDVFRKKMAGKYSDDLSKRIVPLPLKKRGFVAILTNSAETSHSFDSRSGAMTNFGYAVETDKNSNDSFLISNISWKVPLLENGIMPTLPNSVLVLIKNALENMNAGLKTDLGMPAATKASSIRTMLSMFAKKVDSPDRKNERVIVVDFVLCRPGGELFYQNSDSNAASEKLAEIENKNYGSLIISGSQQSDNSAAAYAQFLGQFGTKKVVLALVEQNPPRKKKTKTQETGVKESLQTQIRSLERKINSVEEENKGLKEENEALTGELEKLKEQLAASNKNFNSFIVAHNDLAQKISDALQNQALASRAQLATEIGKHNRMVKKK